MTTTSSDHSIDAFHRGAFYLAQPVDGHRAGMDALLLAAALPADFAGTVADLGAGAGAAGLAVLSRCPGARAVLVEREPRMIEAARITLSLPANASIAGRARIVEADVELSGRARVEAGLPDNAFDFAIMNPPFNLAGDRQTADSLKRAAHVMHDQLPELWLRTAAAIVRPGAGLAIIARPVSLQPILAALHGRFGGAEIVPVHPRADAAAIRVLVRARSGSRARLSLLPPLVLHDGRGQALTARADDIVNGVRSLY